MRMRHIFFCVSVLCLLGCDRSNFRSEKSQHDDLLASSEPAVELNAGLILEPREVNLGNQGVSSNPVNVDFVLRNETSRSISIGRIQTSCGCTAAASAKGVLAPGESTSISASVKIRELGPRESRIRVQSADGVYGVSARVYWNGGSTVTVSPGSLAFGEILRGASATTEVAVTSPDGTCISEWLLDAEVVPARECSIRRVDEGDTARLSVTVSPRGTADEYRGTVKLICRHPVGEILVPVEWRTEDNVSLKPRGAFRNNLPPGSTWRQKFLLHSRVASIAIAAPQEYGLVQEEIRPGLVSCEVSVQAPQSAGPFNIKVPIDVDFGDHRRRNLTFDLSGIVAP